jgi:hypothetical protein
VTAVVIVMGVLAGGAWLRYAVVPVLAAYAIGRRVEMLAAARRRGRGA